MLFAGVWVAAVAEGDFQHFRQIEIAGQDIRFFAERTHFDTPAASAGPRVFQGLALAQLFLHHGVGVEDRRKAIALTDHAQGMLQEAVGTLARKLDVAARLEQMHLVDDIQQHVRNLVAAVGAVAQQTAEVDVGEVGERAALGRRHSHFGRRGMVVELDEEHFQKLTSRLGRERAIGQPLLIERQQMLVEMPRVERVPAVEFRDHRQMAEPVILQGLLKIPWRVLRNPPTDFGNPGEFRLAHRIGLSSGQVVGQVGMAMGEQDDRVARDVHRLERFALVVRFGVAQEIEPRDGRGDIAFEVAHPLVIDLVIQHRVAGGTLFHELGEHAGLVGIEPLWRQFGKHPLAHRPAAPVGNHDLFIGCETVRIDLVTGLRS